MKGKAAFLSEYTELYGTGEVRTEGEPSQIDTCCVESYFCATSCTAALLFFCQRLLCLPLNFLTANCTRIGFPMEKIAETNSLTKTWDLRPRTRVEGLFA